MTQVSAGALGVLAAALWAAVPAAAAYEAATASDGGTLTGVVKFVGARPALVPLAVTRNREVCGDPAAAEALVVDREGGVRGSVVLIEGVTRGKKAQGDAVIDTARCRFVPHVAAAMAGTRARVRNSDPVFHHPRGFLGPSTVFNVAIPGKEQVVDITRRLTKPGVVRLRCDAHPHMSGWLYVHDSPYVTTTDERGAYRIDGIPPRTWKVTMWHEGFRKKRTDRDGRPVYGEPLTTTRTVTIGPRTAVSLDFELR